MRQEASCRIQSKSHPGNEFRVGGIRSGRELPGEDMGGKNSS